jgi:hypothetical protein
MRHTSALPRRAAPGLLHDAVPRKQEGAGKTGCTLHPRSHVQKCKNKTHTSIQVSGGNPAFPAQWFYVLLRALPGDRAFLPPSLPRSLLPKNLTPASGRQDHTTSPYAMSAARRTTPSRPPHPASNVRDDRDTSLLWERDGAEMQLIWRGRKAGYFLTGGWTRQIRLKLLSKSLLPRARLRDADQGAYCRPWGHPSRRRCAAPQDEARKCGSLK